MNIHIKYLFSVVDITRSLKDPEPLCATALEELAIELDVSGLCSSTDVYFEVDTTPLLKSPAVSYSAIKGD